MDEVERVISELSSLCDDNSIKFSYYNDIQNECYSYRFEKYGVVSKAVVRFKISYIDLKYKGHSIIMHEINNKIYDLYDHIRKN